MAIPTIIVYSNSSNLNTIRLLNNKEPVDLASVTHIVLRLSNGRSLSSQDEEDIIYWEVSDLPTKRGKVYMWLGYVFFTTRDYIADVLVYDDLNRNGIFWGNLRIRSIEGGPPYPLI